MSFYSFHLIVGEIVRKRLVQIYRLALLVGLVCLLRGQHEWMVAQEEEM